MKTSPHADRLAIGLLAICLFTHCSVLSRNRDARSPRITYHDHLPQIVLPASMATALQDTYPRFRTYDLLHYNPQDVRLYRFTPKQAMSAVIGDFNADNILDIVLDGTDQQHSLRLCILSRSDHYNIILVDRFPLTLSTDTYLIALPRAIKPDDPRCTAPSDRDTFAVVATDKGGVLYYYDNDVFVDCLLSD